MMGLNTLPCRSCAGVSKRNAAKSGVIQTLSCDFNTRVRAKALGGTTR